MIRSAHSFAVALGIMLASAALPGTAIAEPKDQIAMQVDDEDRMTITLKVAGKDVPAVLDTAATYLLIDRQVLDDANSRPLDSPVEILGMDGKREYPTTIVGPVSAGDTQLGTLQAAINSQSRFIGHRTIVPVSALPGRSVDFDFENNKIELSDRRPVQPRKNVVTRIKYEDVNGLHFVPDRLNGKLGRALIDTGSDVTYVNSAFAAKAKAKLELEKTRRLFGTASMGVQVRIFSARKFKIGSHKMSNFDVLSADPPLFKHLGIEDEPVMVIGLDLLRKFRLQIDRRNEVILLGRKPPPGSARHFSISPQHGRVRRH